MSKHFVFVFVIAIVCPGTAVGFETDAVIRKVDADKRVLVVFAGGQERTVRVAKDARFLDMAGKELGDGLAAAVLKAGATVTLTLESGSDNRPEIKVVQLGKKSVAPAQDTANLKPLTELGAEKYHGFSGGLYPDGANLRPRGHEAAGKVLAAKIVPLDAEGNHKESGKIVVLGVGMSNTSQAFGAFVRLAQEDKEKNPLVTLVNGAQGGMTAALIQTADEGRGAQYWQEVDRRLQAAGVTRHQVQVVWIKQADAGPTQGFPRYAQTLQGELLRIVQLLPRRFPNIKLVYLSSRTYGGFAKTRLNPEPYAYESGLSVKWLIEQQLKGEPELNFDAAKGEVKAPWLSWGPYLWANGARPRADGFRYEESDFANDGTHESPAGQRKVAGLLLQFFKTDSTTRDWFVRADK